MSPFGINLHDATPSLRKHGRQAPQLAQVGSSADAYCISAVVGGGLPQRLVLGDTFLRAFYSVYTYEPVSGAAWVALAPAALGDGQAQPSATNHSMDVEGLKAADAEPVPPGAGVAGALAAGGTGAGPGLGSRPSGATLRWPSAGQPWLGAAAAPVLRPSVDQLPSDAAALARASMPAGHGWPELWDRDSEGGDPHAAASGEFVGLDMGAPMDSRTRLESAGGRRMLLSN